jgi:hypothetical protein
LRWSFRAGGGPVVESSLGNSFDVSAGGRVTGRASEREASLAVA